MFKFYKQKLKNKSIKKSSISSEFYSKCNETCQHKGPFTNYFQECAIVAQYTMLVLLSRMEQLKYEIRYSLDMFRSMTSQTNLAD